MEQQDLNKFWPLIQTTVEGFWSITEPQIEDSAIQKDIPIELYLFGELGLEYFSVKDFQKRDPFTNPNRFDDLFVRFELKGWVFPLPGDRYQVSRKAREAVRELIEAGDARLLGFELLRVDEMKQLCNLLKKIAKANIEAPEPPEKWAIIKRFRAAHSQSPDVVQVRELLMDLFAYRDDCHLSAARPHFGQAGIVWDVLGSVDSGEAVNAGQMAERLSYRAYGESDYEVAIQAAVKIGWIETDDSGKVFRATGSGRELRESVERKTNKWFFRSWSVLSSEESNRVFALLTHLRENLTVYRRSISEPG